MSNFMRVKGLKMPACLILLAAVCFLFNPVAFAESVPRVTIRTRAENNRNASVWYRVFEHYREIAVVAPPEFCTLPPNAKLVR